ncbi:MAG: hypothetical protein ACR2MN_06595 [Acidimicrobiales bacterium]
MAHRGGAGPLAIRLDHLLTEVEEILPGAVALLEDAAVLRRTFAPVLAESLPTLRLFANSLAQMAPLLDEAAPLLRELLPVLSEASPALMELAPLGQDLVPILAEAAPGLHALAPMLENLAPVVGRLPELVDDLGRNLAAVGALADPKYGMAAVASNTQHMVELFDDLSQQLASIPGASLLRRRNGRVD